MKFSYNWIKEFVPKVSGAEELAENLNMRAFEVEEISENGKDKVLEIKILANRAFDCMSHLGMAREIAAVENREFNQPEIKIEEQKDLNVNDLLKVSVQDKKLCPRYSARVVVDVRVGESPDWMKEKLISCGLRPINNIVDITNYVMLECGQPLHAFDLDKVGGGQIIVRRAKSGENINTLDEGKSERELNENILVIADKENPVAIAGIKGGKGPEIDENTKRVALEAANFDSINIRKSSKALNLRTDASTRFENGVDLNLTVWSLDRAAQLLAELAGGKVAQGIIDEKAGERAPFSNGVEHHYIESLLGLQLKSEAIMDIFKRLGLPAKILNKGDKIFYEITVPTPRNDLNTQEDLIEEVGRLYGYENIQSKMPMSIILPALKDENLIYTDEIRDIMVGLGYSEASNYSFVGADESKFYNFNDLIDVLNPLSQEQRYLRPNLFAGLIRNLQENLKNWHSLSSKKHALRLFEIGHAFSQEKKEIIEKKKLAGILYISESQKNQAFYELKGVLEILLNRLGLAEAWTDDHLEEGLPKNYILNPKRTAQIKAHDRVLGYMGELDPKICDELGILGQPALFEIDFESLVQSADDQRKYEPPSKFPANIRDLSVLVDSQVKIDEVASAIENVGGELLQDSELFDLYEGDDLDSEQKSLAFHLIFQSNERNLADSEVNEIMKKIISALEEKGWEVRK